jgi:RsiW-degrading membrane proteinase PrsW (M82 family)
MAEQWYHTESGREQGPWSSLEMRDLVRRGRITATTPVRRDGMTASVPAGNVRGLLPTAAAASAAKPAPAVATAPPPPPPPAAPRRDADAASDLYDDAVLGDPRPVSTVKPATARTANPAPAAPAADSLFEESAPRPKPARQPAVVAAAAPVTAPKPKSLPTVELRQPTWTDLWPLAALSLLLGWICGGYGDFGRIFPKTSVLPIGLLALGGVPVALAGFFFFLRPRRVSPWQLLAVAAFTAVFGILALLVLQVVAISGVHIRLSILGMVLALIGEAYRLTESPNIIARWFGFVFGVGLCEETTKLLPLVLLVYGFPRSTEGAARWDIDRHTASKKPGFLEGKPRPLDLPTFLCCGFASGMGFGIGEAVYCYAPWNGNFHAGMNIIRWFSAVPSHAVYTTISAAFLWKLGDHLENAEGFWGHARVVATAAAAMAVVHGTYDTVCTLGIWPSLLMEALTFGLLVVVLRWVMTGEREAPDAPHTPWVPEIARPLPMLGGLAVAVLMMVVALGLALNRRAGIERVIQDDMPPAMKAYVGEGVTVDHDTSGNPLALPLSAHFRLETSDHYADIAGTFTNVGDAAIRDLSITCISVDHETTTVDVGTLAPGESTVIDGRHGGWSFYSREQVVYQVPGKAPVTIQLP